MCFIFYNKYNTVTTFCFKNTIDVLSALMSSIVYSPSPRRNIIVASVFVRVKKNYAQLLTY